MFFIGEGLGKQKIRRQVPSNGWSGLNVPAPTKGEWFDLSADDSKTFKR
jgi:hypothetical protein